MEDKQDVQELLAKIAESHAQIGAILLLSAKRGFRTLTFSAILFVLFEVSAGIALGKIWMFGVAVLMVAVWFHFRRDHLVLISKIEKDVTHHD